ncbi:MAG TPA: SH3 domain-containing protein [Devosiaceae bacterium]|nr:SH3 domain-containing protein [Devosiaceae bacterium]
MRSGSSNGSGRLFALTGGTKVEVTGEERGWLNLVDSEGRSGWAYSEYFD